MKQQVFFIHGGDAFSNREDFLQYLKQVPIRNLPEQNEASKAEFWSRSLAEDLGDDYEVFTPSMPNKQNASYDEWSIWFERHFEYFRDDVILVGWSLGGMFLAKYLSNNPFPHKIKTLHLLAAPCGEQVDPEGNDCGSFQFAKEELANLTAKIDTIEIWHSTDDFVVPYQQALEYKKHLNKANLHTFDDKNHFLVAQFPELLDNIKNQPKT